MKITENRLRQQRDVKTKKRNIEIVVVEPERAIEVARSVGKEMEDFLVASFARRSVRQKSERR